MLGRRLTNLLSALALLISSCVGRPLSATAMVGSSNCATPLHVTGAYAFDHSEIYLSDSSIVKVLKSGGAGYGRVVGADSSGAWVIDQNGTMLTGSDDDRRNLLTERAILCADPALFNDLLADGRQYAGKAPGGWPVQSVVELGTRQILRGRFTANGIVRPFNIDTTIASPSNSHFPGAWDIDWNMVFVAKSAEYAPTIVPRSYRPWGTPSAVSVGNVGYQYKSGQIVVPARIGTISGSCILDTGTTGIAVSSAMANEITGDISRITVKTQNHFGYARAGRIGTMEALGVRFTSPVVFEDPRLAPNTAICGLDFLARATISIDFVNHKVRTSKTPLACKDDCTPMVVTGPTFEANVGGRKVRMLLDSGYTGELMVTPTIAASLQVRHSALPPVTEFDSGQCLLPGLRSANVSIGAATVDANLCPVDVNTTYDAVIGAGAIARFGALTLDLAHGIARFEAPNIK